MPAKQTHTDIGPSAGDLPVVVIAGRPNVGKSTLFNRLSGRRSALVADTPGVTRDRKDAEAVLRGRTVRLVDTAGLEESAPDTLYGRMRASSQAAVAQADLVVFVVDARAGITPADSHFAEWLRRQGRPVLLVANKTEGRGGAASAMDAFSLGLGDPVAISAEHGDGLSGLMSEIAERLPGGRRTAPPADDSSATTRRRARRAAGQEGAPAVDAAPAGATRSGPQASGTSPRQGADPGGTDLPASMLGDAEALRAVRAAEAACAADEAAPSRPLRLAIVGRPNAGKSTLLNRLLGEERMITGPEPGLTRDSVLSVLHDPLGDVELVDTAGLRKKARIEAQLERMSVSATIEALKMAEVVVLCIDAELGLHEQDLQIARLIEREGRACVLALNKWDAVEDRQVARRAISDRLETSLAQMKGIPVVAFSALTGAGIGHLLPTVRAAHATWNKRVATGALNRWFEHALSRHPTPLVEGKRVKLRYMTQAKARPPTFVVFGTRAEMLPEDYRRYLVNGLREQFVLPGTPVRLQLRGTKNPYADD